MMAAGLLIVVDDGENRVWRIRYTGVPGAGAHVDDAGYYCSPLWSRLGRKSLEFDFMQLIRAG